MAVGEPEHRKSVLIEPIRIGSKVLPNRMVMSPMAVLGASEDGRPTDQTVAVLSARAAGGVGMIIVGGSNASERGFEETPFKGVMRIDVESNTPVFAKIAKAVHAHGTTIIGQIGPGFGRMGKPGRNRDLIAASPVNVVIPRGGAMPFERITPMPRAATKAEIEHYRSDMVDCALRLKRAGWDGVEIAAHMSYFYASFLTPRTNLRTDTYGGGVENRARILVDLVQAIRRATGRDFIIGLRMSSNEYVPGGQEADGYAQIAAKVEAAGLDYVAPTPGCYESINSTTDPAALLIGNGDMAAFRAHLSVPLLLTGIHDPEAASQALEQGHGDLVMLGRPLLADPQYPLKLATGRRDQIIVCDRDNYCIKRLMLGMPVRCKRNAGMGREAIVASGGKTVEATFKRRADDLVLRLSDTSLAVTLARAAVGLSRLMKRPSRG